MQGKAGHKLRTPCTDRSRAHHRHTWLIAGLAAAALTPGCALFRRPVPPPLPQQDVVANVRRQTEGLRTVSDDGIKLVVRTTVDGRTESMPSLGGALAFDMRLPGLWLMAEKLTRRIFTLRATGDGFALAVDDTREVLVGTRRAYARLPFLMRPEDVGWFLGSPSELGLTWPGTRMTLEPEHYRFDVFVGNSLRRQIRVDRRLLAMTEIRQYDSLGRLLLGVELGDHADVDGRVFPRRLAVDRRAAGVKVELRLSDPVLNKDFPASTFQPKLQRGWEVINLDYEDLSRAKFLRGG